MRMQKLPFPGRVCTMCSIAVWAIQMAMELRGARGEGFATITADGRVLDSWFLQLRLLVEAGKAVTIRLTSDEINRSLGESADGYARHDDVRNVDISPFKYFFITGAPVGNPPQFGLLPRPLLRGTNDPIDADAGLSTPPSQVVLTPISGTDDRDPVGHGEPP